MKVRHPAGRAGRPWLIRRLQIARRGAELLDEKYRALTRERRRLQPLVAEARLGWDRRARDAERWLTRAAVLAGERQLDALRSAAIPPADVDVKWRTVLGVACPGETLLIVCPEPERSVVSGSAALISAAAAHRAALEAALELASVAGALRRIESELRLTAIRRNAIERRWIPAHEQALKLLELTLEELEREDAARVRKLAGSSAASTLGTS